MNELGPNIVLAIGLIMITTLVVYKVEPRLHPAGSVAESGVNIDAMLAREGITNGTVELFTTNRSTVKRVHCKYKQYWDYYGYVIAFEIGKE